MRSKKVNPTPEQLSASEYAAMQFIERFRANRHKSPTVREVQTAIGLSVSATHELLSRLVDYGYLTRRAWRDGRRMKRNLRVLKSVLS